ncbi:MAG: putative baseplate assembly protein [Anaerolineae bacterium]|nr:putative baseplate assembly protein [Thermoflexales bacterium]MDW8406740.1 putative baseplate assembly protein [Anaerolineae bacterium]
MSLPEPVLDNLRFQKDLVDEARRRIIRYCPEWTEYNLSDPGITLIELFAWMTELIVYRLNQVPEKNYIRFLNFLGAQLQPATSARGEVTFRTSIPLPIGPEDDTRVLIPQGTEVATRRVEGEPEVIFTTDELVWIVPPRLVQLRREASDSSEDDFNKNYLPRLEVEPFYAFGRPRPQPGDTFYLGFDETLNLSGYILQLAFTCEQTQAAGIRREDPPWVWEVLLGDGTWQELPLSNRPGERDTTGGLNNAQGSLTLYLPLDLQPAEVHGRRAYWLRCRVEQRRREQGMYRESPRVTSVRAFVLGATTRATHAVVVQQETLGVSNGEAGQSFKLRHAPILALGDGERIEVEEMRDGELVFVPWHTVTDFSTSDRHDRHVLVDTTTGEVQFGPCLRQPDGSMRQYGRVPEAGRVIRISRYRHGGGTAGNLPPDKLQVLKSSIPYVDRVTNMARTSGGRDAETLEEARMRLRRALRAQERAVTAEDYERLALAASRQVGRVHCNTHALTDAKRLPPGMVELLIIPAALDAVQAGDLSRLQLDVSLRRAVQDYLDERRLLTATLRLREPTYWGVKVRAEIVVGEYSRPEAVQQRVLDALRALITPLALRWPPIGPEAADSAASERSVADVSLSGWPFGRHLYLSDLYSLIQQTPGVRHVRDVKIGTQVIHPAALRAASPQEGMFQETALTDRRVIETPPDAVLCSLDHEVVIMSL